MIDRPDRSDADSVHIPPTKEELSRLMDPEFWDWETPVEAVRAENPGLRVMVRIAGDDAKQIVAAADSFQMPLPTFMRFCALLVARTMNETRSAPTR